MVLRVFGQPERGMYSVKGVIQVLLSTYCMLMCLDVKDKKINKTWFQFFRSFQKEKEGC